MLVPTRAKFLDYTGDEQETRLIRNSFGRFFLEHLDGSVLTQFTFLPYFPVRYRICLI